MHFPRTFLAMVIWANLACGLAEANPLIKYFDDALGTVRPGMPKPPGIGFPGFKPPPVPPGASGGAYYQLFQTELVVQSPAMRNLYKKLAAQIRANPDDVEVRFKYIISNLLRDIPAPRSLNDVPGPDEIVNQLLKKLEKLSKQEAQSPNPLYTFDIASGKLEIPSLKANVAGGKVVAGKVDIYNVITAVSSTALCVTMGCPEKIWKKLQENFGSRSELILVG